MYHGSDGSTLCRSCLNLGQGAKRAFKEFDGVRYYRDQQGWRSSRYRGHKRLHVAVWEKFNGALPEGHGILFADGDHENFDPLNLICLPKGKWKRFKGSEPNEPTA
jgi:hypothetical protein